MCQNIDFNEMKEILINIAKEIMLEKDNLTNLDSSCGDGDLGVVMYMAFRKGRDRIDKEESGDIGNLFMALGSEILASAGGAAGPLFGTIFLEAGKKVIGKSTITLEDFTIMFECSLAKVKALGGAKVGDKTLVDAFEPAVKTLRESLSKRIGLQKALNLASEETARGTENTRSLIARHGKAKYIGEKSVGFIDPGAKIVQIIFETITSSHNLISSSNLYDKSDN